MIQTILQTIGYTLVIVLSIIVLVAMLYITMWFMAGLGVVLLATAIYYMLRAKEYL